MPLLFLLHCPLSVTILGVCLATGLTLSFLILAIGPLSGAHLNPAVTLAMTLGRAFPARWWVLYSIAQFIGGLLGAAMTQAFFDSDASKGTVAWQPSYSAHSATLYEALLSALLISIIYLLATKGGENQGRH